MSGIDPVQYGALTAQVSTLEAQVAELRADVKALLELANKSKGGFWMGMAVASSFGAFIGWLVEPGAAPILQGHPMIDQLHVVPKKELKSAFWKALRGPGRALADEIKAQGYERDVVLPIRITPPESLQDGTSITLAGKAAYMCCNRQCNPGFAGGEKCHCKTPSDKEQNHHRRDRLRFWYYTRAKRRDIHAIF